jgi:ATP-dependent Lon protease
VPVAHIDDVLARALTGKPEPVEWSEADELASQATAPQGTAQTGSQTAH